MKINIPHATVAIIMAAVSLPAVSCSCVRDDENFNILTEQVNSATQIVRAKVVSRSSEIVQKKYGPQRYTVYKIDVIELIYSSGSDSGGVKVRSSAETSCELNLSPGEEWLLLSREGEVSDCGGHALLGNASSTRKTRPEDNFHFEENYKRAAESLKLVRQLARQR
jgi:hypothetical protein